MIFIVLMLFWLFFGGVICYSNNVFDAKRYGGNTLIPWACVAILGYKVFGGLPP